MMARLRAVVEGRVFMIVITSVIVANAVTLALETAPALIGGGAVLIQHLDVVFLAVFVVELGLKLAVYRLDFFRSGWNIFDLLIIGISLVPFMGSLSVLRAFRILRVLRLLSLVPRLRLVIEALVRAIPGIGAIVFVLLLLYFVSAVLATRLFGAEFPDWFGTIGGSMFTLFAIMTLEGWAEIARAVMDRFPAAWAFFVPFIVVSSFMVLNLFIAIIVNSLQEIEAQEERAMTRTIDAETARVLAEVAALKQEIALLRAALRPGAAAD